MSRLASTGKLAKGLEREEELAKTAEGSSSADVEVDVSQSAQPRSATEQEELSKATTSVAPGAAATQPLGTTYGLTYPEEVTVEFWADHDPDDNTFSPKVTKVTGHYSLQATLLSGQTEITGPDGATSENFCEQAACLKALGMVGELRDVGGGNFYMREAVVRHEKVHARRFRSALRGITPGIVALIEGISVPNEPEADWAHKRIRADPAFAEATTSARDMWHEEILTKVTGDHRDGGPTDRAEKMVTEPMRRAVCRHARQNDWGPCASC